MLGRLWIMLISLVCCTTVTQAAPSIDVTADTGGGLVNWEVTLTPDPSLAPPGGMGTISAEIGFVGSRFNEPSCGPGISMDNVTLGSAFSINTVPPGHNPFDGQDTSGFSADRRSVFLAASAPYSSSGDPLVLLTFTTGVYSSTLTWGGQTILSDTPDEFTGGRITQDGMIFDEITASIQNNDGFFADANVDGTINNNDIPDFVTALLNLSDWEALHPGLDPRFYVDGNLDGLINNEDIVPFVNLSVFCPPFLAHSTTVPEPGSSALLCLGSAAAFCFTQRRRRRWSCEKRCFWD